MNQVRRLFTWDESSPASDLASARLSRDDADILEDATGEPSSDEWRDDSPPLRVRFQKDRSQGTSVVGLGVRVRHGRAGRVRRWHVKRVRPIPPRSQLAGVAGKSRKSAGEARALGVALEFVRVGGSSTQLAMLHYTGSHGIVSQSTAGGKSRQDG